MSSLSPNGRSLVEAGRRAYRVAYRPTDESRARLGHALEAQLNNPASPPSTSPAAASASSSGITWPLVSAILVGAGIVGGAILFTRDKPSPSAPQQAPIVLPVAVSPPVATNPIAEPPAPPLNKDPAASAVQPSIPLPSTLPGQRRGVRLTHEVELLSRATRALHAGRAAEALKALDEYRRKFPKGWLRDEESAARAQVLCDLGRFDEARATMAKLPSQSPLSARTRQFCDSRMK